MSTKEKRLPVMHTPVTRTLVLGIGNTLLTDEGAGIHAMQQLQTLYQAHADKVGHAHDDITFLDGGTLSFTLASWIEDHDELLVLDAAKLDKPAGTVETFTGDAMDDFLGRCKHSAHEVGLLDLMDIARLTGHLPEHRALVGIQPDIMTWGMEPAPAVAASLPKAAQAALEILLSWREQADDQSVQGTGSGRHTRHEQAKTKAEAGVQV